MEFSYPKDSLEQMPYAYYLEEYQLANPHEISIRTQFPYYDTIHAFRLRFLERLYEVSYPDFSIRQLGAQSDGSPLENNIYAKIWLLRYLLEGDAVTTAGNMISYRDIPWGDTYYPQFFARCIRRLVDTFGNRPDAFGKAMEYLYGVPAKYGDHSYQFELIPGYSICLILWDGDSEYAPSAQILFSDNFPSAFTAEDVVQICEVILDAVDRENH